MNFLRTPRLLQNLFPEIIWKNETPEILLTFDDGPDPLWTLKFCTLLEKFNARGLFFIIGDHVQDVSVLKTCIANGHQLGWHSQTHRSFYRLSKKDIDQELEARKKIEDLLDYRFKHFRFPYGRFLPWQIKYVHAHGLAPMLWNLMIHDYKLKERHQLLRELRLAKSSDILLLHDKNPNAEVVYSALEEFLSETHLTFCND